MAISDPIADLLTRIRNGQQARMPSVECPASKLRASILDVLVREGYIRGYSETAQAGQRPVFTIELKYHEGESVIKQIDRVSRPGQRVYAGIKDLGRFYNGLGISILSTPRGVMSDAEARAAHVGGEVLCKVF